MTTLDPGLKARVLRSAAAVAPHNHSLGEVALRHELAIDQVEDIVQKHGWPRPESMRRAARILDEQAADRDAAAGAGAEATRDHDGDVLLDVPLDRIHPDPNNPREDLGDLTELAASLNEAGLVQPVVLRQERTNGAHPRLVLVSGHRRAAAARKIGWTSIPAVVKAPRAHSADELLVRMLAENGQREPLDPIEEARALATLKERDGLSDIAIARKVSRSQPYISGRLALLDLTPEQQTSVRAGLMPLSAATTAGRKLGGNHRPAALGKKSAAHLTEHHPLADLVQQHCRAAGHHKNTPGRVGGIACGRCWEDIIRADERRKLSVQ